MGQSCAFSRNSQSSEKPDTRRSDDSPVALIAVKSSLMEGVNAGAPVMVWCAFARRNAASVVSIVLMVLPGYFRARLDAGAAAAGEMGM